METEANDSLDYAQERYNHPLNPETTKEISDYLKRAEAERLAFAAIIDLCEFLNRFNGVVEIDFEKEDAKIKAALEINPKLASAYYAMGFLNRARGFHREALAAFQQSLEFEPDNPRALAQEGAEHLYLGDAKTALSRVQRALELSPNHPAQGMFLWIVARAYFFSGDYPSAIPPLQRSIELWPSLWYSRAYEVSAYARIGDKETAARKLADFNSRFPDLNTIEQIQRAESTNPNNNPFVVAGREEFHRGLYDAGMPER